MPPRKRARADAAPAEPKTPTKRTKKTVEDEPPPVPPLPKTDSAAAADDEPSASHLVSFLTSYTDRYDEREHGSDSDSGSSDGEKDDDFDDQADEDDDDEEPATPMRGLVGTPGRRKTPATTPRRRAATTPRKPKTPKKVEQEDEGFLRTSRADRYFMQATKGSRTSGMSYSALARPLSQAEYESVVNGARGKSKAVQKNLDDLARYFPQWAAELETGFNLLLYGYGSKRRLVNRFAKDTLNDLGDVVVVNGTFPGIGLKDVLGALEARLSLSEDVPAPIDASPLERSAYRVYQSYRSGVDHLYMIIHNIDAPGMKAPKSLSALSLLASCPGIHIIATFDHVNTPLLFSATLANAAPHKPSDGEIPASRGFNWIYHSVATFDDYDVELSYARLSSRAALGQSTGTISEEGALQILHSVPPMAARLLKLILLKQLDNGDGPLMGVGGAAPAYALDVDLVQKAARDKFIAREEERFNALLGEFKDHGLVVTAELDAEGRQGRWAWVPLPRAAIERILEEMKNVEA